MNRFSPFSWPCAVALLVLIGAGCSVEPDVQYGLEPLQLQSSTADKTGPRPSTSGYRFYMPTSSEQPWAVLNSSTSSKHSKASETKTLHVKHWWPTSCKTPKSNCPHKRPCSQTPTSLLRPPMCGSSCVTLPKQSAPGCGTTSRTPLRSLRNWCTHPSR